MDRAETGMKIFAASLTYAGSLTLSPADFKTGALPQATVGFSISIEAMPLF